MNTKTKGLISVIGIFTLLLCATITFAQNGRVIKASSSYKTKEIKIGKFDQIKLQGSPEIVYTQSSNGKSELKVTGSDNLLDVLECEVTNNVLIVKFKNNTNVQFGKVGRLKVMASSPSLKSVHVQGSGDVTVSNNLKCTDLALDLQGSGDIKVGAAVCTSRFSANLQGSGDIIVENRLQAASAVLKVQGSGDLNIRGIRAEQVTAYLQGSGDITLAGTTLRASLTLSSSGSLDAKSLNATDVDAKLSGSGSISCSASGSLKGHTSGSGRIGYIGNPSVESTGRNKMRKL